MCVNILLTSGFCFVVAWTSYCNPKKTGINVAVPIIFQCSRPPSVDAHEGCILAVWLATQLLCLFCPVLIDIRTCWKSLCSTAGRPSNVSTVADTTLHWFTAVETPSLQRNSTMPNHYRVIPLMARHEQSLPRRQGGVGMCSSVLSFKGPALRGWAEVLGVLQTKSLSQPELLLGRPTLVGRLKLYCCTFFLFYQCIFLRNGADDGHQIYTRGSAIEKALNRNPEISPTPPLIFTGG